MRRKNGNLIGWLFLAPSMILYLWFFIYPVIEAFRLSFYKWSGFKLEKEFIGIKNYIILFKDDTFYFVIKNTFLILVVGGIFIFLLAFCFSVMMGSGIKGKRFFRNSILLPYKRYKLFLFLFVKLTILIDLTPLLTSLSTK